MTGTWKAHDTLNIFRMSEYIRKAGLLALLLLIDAAGRAAQAQGTWTVCWNADTTAFGFSDERGVVQVAPRFRGLAWAKRLDRIMAVTEGGPGPWVSYYLTRSGRTIGRDSVYVFDNAMDCEREGYIRFTSRQTGLVGMFNGQGDVAIPAQYDALTKVRNGMVLALQGAKKTYWAGGEHYSWVGGRQMLLDTGNRVLVDSMVYDGHLDFRSLRISDQPHPDPLRQSFRGTDGRYYSFVDVTRDFRAWLRSLVDSLDKGRLLEATYSEVTCWKPPQGWVKEPTARFMGRNFARIRAALQPLRDSARACEIFEDGLNSFTYAEDRYRRYFDNCGAPDQDRYPVEDVVISHRAGKDLTQDHFEFLRTDEGYRLISVTVDGLQ